MSALCLKYITRNPTEDGIPEDETCIRLRCCRWLINLLVDAHDDVIKWKHFPRYRPFVWWIHRSPVNSPHKGQWRGALIFFMICARINGWVNNREAGDFRRNPAHYDVTVISLRTTGPSWLISSPMSVTSKTHAILSWNTKLINSLRPSDTHMRR